MSNFTEKVCFFLTWVFQGSNYLSAYGYGVMHRMHHAYVDTEKDPHSPKYDSNLFSMMWRTKSIYQDINNNRIELDTKFTKNTPQWAKFDNFASSTTSRVIWGLLYTLFFYFFATAWWQWLFLPVAFLMAPIHGVIINWFGHIVGYTNFQVNNTSKNLLPFDFLMMGEGYHNNHHKYSHRANFGGIRWYEIDPTFYIMIFLNSIGIIQLKKRAIAIKS
ncbi:acyl-CoA desaturase [Aquimarina addita]|uniref:Acyl-CoA desaturase n=2 Tax=Aquimarina addita TaxID=870485 RepID=A0ABP7XBL7_9FLAO